MGASFERFGIVGYGHFGEFFARSLAAKGLAVTVTDADTARLPPGGNGVSPAALDEVAGSDVVVLAVPAAALASVVESLHGRLAPATVVMDVVSTKARPTAILESSLPSQQCFVATHPLFGPPSMETIQPGDRIVVTRARGERGAELVRFLEHGLDLRVVDVGADEHDRAMAYMQALPFFIARALDRLEFDHFRDDLEIPSFHKLAEVARIERHHSSDMFETSQLDNPYAREAREQFLAVLRSIDAGLSDAQEEVRAIADPDIPPELLGERERR